jgi:hypothetical protein
MLKRVPLLEAFDKAQMRNSQADYLKHLRIFQALYEEAKQLGVFALKEPLEGIDVDIHLAKVLNVRTTAGKNRPSQKERILNHENTKGGKEVRSEESPAFAPPSYGEAGRLAGSAKALYESAWRNFYRLSRWKKK